MLILSTPTDTVDDGPYANHPRLGNLALTAREEIFTALTGGRVIAAIIALRRGNRAWGSARRKIVIDAVRHHD